MTMARLGLVLGLLSFVALSSWPSSEARASSDVICAVAWMVSSANQSCSDETITYADDDKKCTINAKCDRKGSGWFWDKISVDPNKVGQLNNCDGRLTLTDC